jgi:threonine/homoserine/homoserine lactone efflux protein
MIPLLAGIVVGVVVAIPPGPMSMIILKQTLNHGARRGMVISLGTTTLDFLYCLAFMFAAGTLFGQITAWLAAHAIIVAIFQAVCVVGLIGYGVHSLRLRAPVHADNTPQTLASSAAEQPDTPKILPKAFTTHGPFLLGLGLSLTQLANPTFVPLMTYVSLTAHDRGFVTSMTGAASAGLAGAQAGAQISAQYLIFALGYAIGIFAWLYTVIRLSTRYRTALSSSFLLWLNRFVGLTLIVFGGYLAYRLALALGWLTA